MGSVSSKRYTSGSSLSDSSEEQKKQIYLKKLIADSNFRQNDHEYMQRHKKIPKQLNQLISSSSVAQDPIHHIRRNKWEMVDYLGSVDESNIYEDKRRRPESWESRTRYAHAFLLKFNIKVSKI